LKFAEFILRRSKVVLFVTVVLAALGVYAYTATPSSIFPRMSFARIDVVADAGDLTPERVRVAVTRSLAAAVASLPAVTRVRSTSSQGSAEVLVDFTTTTDPRVDLQEVQAAISSVQPTLPAARRIDAVIVDPNAEPVVSFAFTSRALSQAALRAFLETRVLPAFAGTPGLRRVNAVGGPPIEFRVELDPAALAAVGLSAADVAHTIADASAVQAVGTAERYGQRYVLLIDAGIHDARSLGRIAIPLHDSGSIALASLGTVRLGVGPALDDASVNGMHAVVVNAYALAGADVVTLARAFEARLARVRAVLPADVQIVTYWDQTRLIVDALNSLRDAIFVGALLAIAVIAVFLRSARMTLVAAIIIPLALAIAVLVLERAGLSLNLMSVGGLAIAVGLIIDDVIVVVEGIASEMAAHPNVPRREAIARSMSRLGGAMAASTATTVVVFVPLGLLTGVSGFFFRALAFTLAASLLVSLVLATCVAPILADMLVRREAHRSETHDRLRAAYEPVLRWALAHRGAVFAGAAVVLATTVVLLARLPSDFLPQLDEGEFEIKYTLPSGATLAASDSAATLMERIVRSDRDVVSVGRLTGIDTNGFTPTQPNVGTLRIALRTSHRDGYEAIADRLRERLTAAIPAANLDFHQLLEDQINDLSGAPSPLEVDLVGPDQERLNGYADAMTDAMAKVPGVVDGFNGVLYDDPVLRIAPRAATPVALGASAGDIGDALGARAQGLAATDIPGEATTIPVRVIVGGHMSANEIDGATLITSAGPSALRSLARIDQPPRASDVNEENGRRIVRVTANVENASLSTVVDGVRAAIARVALAPGYAAQITGEYETQQASFREFASVIGIAIVLVFTVMLATFGSFRLPLVILCAIPLALIGVALALTITRTPINVASFMGLLLLVGIVVKNGILLIDAANRHRLAGDEVGDALIAAGRARVRPIVMTTLAAIGGLFPLALGVGSGAEMERPLAIAVIGGLATATLFTLVLIPVLYATFVGRQSRGLAHVVTTVLLVAAVMFAPLHAQAQTTTTRGFTVSTLADAQTRAVDVSPDVAAARAAVGAATAVLAQARGANGVAATAGYSAAPQGTPGGTVAQHIGSIGAQISLGDISANTALVAQAAATLRAAQSDELVAVREEREKTIGLYYVALKARALVGVRRDAAELAQRQADAAEIRFRVGDAPRLDVVRARVALARAQSDLALANAADANATDALAQELGLTPSALAATTEVAETPSEPLSPERAVMRALALRADLRSADNSVEAANAGVTAAQRALLPPVTLAAGYDRGTDSGFPISGATASAQIAIPLSGTAAARVREQRALVDVARAKRDGIARRIALDAAAAARNLAGDREAERAADAALAAAREELDAATLGYAHGASSSLEVGDARTTYVGALVDDLSAHYDRLAAQAVLSVEVGS
jgi:CzcA family heavy metal efflux pump